MATIPPNYPYPVVSIVPRSDHSIDVCISGAQGGKMCLNVPSKGASVMMYGLDSTVNIRGYSAGWSLLANGHLRGWLARKNDKMEWFPARKTRAPPLAREEGYQKGREESDRVTHEGRGGKSYPPLLSLL